MDRNLVLCFFILAIPCLGEIQQDSLSQSNFKSLETEIKNTIAADLPKAIALSEQGLKDAREIDNKLGEVRMLNLLEEAYFRLADYSKAVDYGLTSIERNKAFVHDDILLANAYRTLGNIYNVGLKQYDEALEYYQTALKIYLSRKDQAMIATQYGSISWLYGLTGRHMAEGLVMAKEGIRIAQSINNLSLLSYNYNSKGFLHHKMGMYDSAITELQKSLEYGQQVNDKTVVAYNKALIGNAYLKKEMNSIAIRYLREAEQESEELDVREVTKVAYLGISQYYEAIGDLRLALAYFQKYTALKDSLLNSEVSEKAIFYNNRIENEHQQSIIAQLELDNQRAKKEKQFVILLLVMGVLLFFLIFLFVTKGNRQRKAANRLLQEKNDAIVKQNKELEKLNGTKDKLFSIIGHDMRSPIGNLNSILELMKKNMMQPDEMQQLLPKLNQSVGGLHEMLESLLEWSHSQMQGFQLNPERFSLKDIADTTLSFYQSAAHAKNIMLSSNIPVGMQAFADKNHVLLALRNLVNNAIKFTNEAGTVLVNAKDIGDRIEVSVQDTGIGIEPTLLKNIFEFQQGNSKRGTHGEKGTGFGLALCKEMVKANRGKITVQTEVGKGTEFRFTLPKDEWVPEVPKQTDLRE